MQQIFAQMDICGRSYKSNNQQWSKHYKS